jgi:hypothetical protein
MFKVVHNGYKIEYFDTIEDVHRYISESTYNERIRCRKILDKKVNNKTRLVRYMYDTLYEEDFLIDDESIK